MKDRIIVQWREYSRRSYFRFCDGLPTKVVFKLPEGVSLEKRRESRD